MTDEERLAIVDRICADAKERTRAEQRRRNIKWLSVPENAEKMRLHKASPEYRKRHLQIARSWAAKPENREKKRTAALDKYYGDHEQAKALARAHMNNWLSKPENRERKRRRTFVSKFGMSLEDRDRMLAEQGNCCAICKKDNPGTKYDWHTDHCHATGVVRGVLCHSCNVALGHMKDNRATLFAAVAYLDKFTSEQTPMLEAA